MPAGSTYSPIATTTLSSNTATVTFSSIPSTYTDLILEAVMLQTGTATATNGFVNVNSVNATVFGRLGLQGSSAGLSVFGNQMDRLYFSVDADASNWAFHSWHFMNYANTNIYKPIIARQNCSSNLVAELAYLWQNTAAINTVSITASDNMGGGTAEQFTAGSTFTLYGIASA